MVDRYTKAVLTIIAVALCTIAWGNIKPSTQVYAQMAGCGDPQTPCSVVLVGIPGGGPLPVFVTNK